MIPIQPLFIFGDSVIKGVMHAEDKYKLCGDHDFASLRDAGFAAHNFSKMGATVRTGLDILRRKLPDACEEGTIVLLSFGGNDCDYDWERVAADPEGEHHPHLPPEQFVSLYCELIETARASGAQVAVATTVPIDAERYMQTISRERNGENILKWHGDVYRLYRWQEYYNALSSALAQSAGCPLLDVRSKFVQSVHFPALLSDDGIHPSAEGHALLHQTLASLLAGLPD